MHRRTVAALVAPIVAVLTVWGVLNVVSLSEETLIPRLSILALFGIFGLPIAYSALAVVGLPAYFILKQLDRLTMGPVVAVGAIAGALTMYLVPTVFGSSGPDTGAVAMALLGGGAGAVSGFVFWFIGLHGEPTNHPVD